MNYLVLRKWRNYEWRLYSDNSKFEGQIIYKGHKMGLDNNLLLEVIETKIMNNNSFELLKYDEGDLKVSSKRTWIKTDRDKLLKTLMESWKSALNKLEIEDVKCKKIIITKLFL